MRWFIEVDKDPIARSQDPIARSKGSRHHWRACVCVKGDALSEGIKARNSRESLLCGLLMSVFGVSWYTPVLAIHRFWRDLF